MNIFFDTEFTGLVPHTSLISIGLVSEFGEEFYAEVTDFNRKLVTKWIFDNVIDNLMYTDDDPQFLRESSLTRIVKGTSEYVGECLRDWIDKLYFYHSSEIQFISDVSHYDTVLLFGLFGGAINLPKYISPAVYDINQMISERCGISMKEAFDISREELILGSYGECPDGEKHNSLYDARVIKTIYDGFNSDSNRSFYMAHAKQIVEWNRIDK